MSVLNRLTSKQEEVLLEFFDKTECFFHRKLAVLSEELLYKDIRVLHLLKIFLFRKTGKEEATLGEIEDRVAAMDAD